MGEAPDWYEVIVAAKYLEVAPWDLIEHGLYWKHWALTARSAELEAENSRQDEQNSRGTNAPQ